MPLYALQSCNDDGVVLLTAFDEDDALRRVLAYLMRINKLAIEEAYELFVNNDTIRQITDLALDEPYQGEIPTTP